MIGFGISAANAEVVRGPSAAPGADVFCAMTSASATMTGGKISVSSASFLAACAYSIKFYNQATGLQMGATKTGSYSGTPVSTSGVTCADGIVVIAKYTCTTSAPGYKNVTNETVIWTKTMVNGSGESPPELPENPI